MLAWFFPFAMACVWGAQTAEASGNDCDRLGADRLDPAWTAADSRPEVTGEPAQVVKACMAAALARPDEPRFAYQLAWALDRQKRREEAAPWYRRAAEQG